MSEDAGIEPRTVASLAVGRSNYSARSHPFFMGNLEGAKCKTYMRGKVFLAIFTSLVVLYRYEPDPDKRRIWIHEGVKIRIQI